MSCSRTPPSSPRAPKIQQQSWDDCGTPPIDLFDPSKDIHSPRSPSTRNHFDPPLSPKAYRDNTGISYTSSTYGDLKSPKPPRKLHYIGNSNTSNYNDTNAKHDYTYYGVDDSCRSPKITYSSSNQDDMPTTVDGTENRKYFEERSPKYLYDQSPRKSPKSPRHFVFDAVSPRVETMDKPESYKSYSNTGTSEMCDSAGSYYSGSSSALKNLSKFNRNKQMSHHSYHQSPIELHTPSDITTSVSKDTFIFTNLDKRRQNPPTELSSEDSAATTARCGSITTDSHISNSGCGINGRSRSRNRRRHAINITSNPGYQALHTSHSTLDRTCSDSVVSLHCRKSTSDLTNVTDNNSTPVTHHKRRGSSKGGLAYLASRRNSRDSMKSAASNASIFSNEDIGPLAFQTSARGRQRRTSNFLELPVPDHIRPRVCSLPERPYNPRQSDDLYRLRTFSISKGTVVNCGDSIISRRSRSNTSVNSTTSRASERSPFDGSCCGGGYTTVDSLPPSPTDSEPPPPPRYRVVMMGDSGTGKTALVSQFMTSEYMHTYDASLDDEFGEKTVSILLDGEESEMIFIDHPSAEMSVENSLSTYEPHSCVVVYSVVQRSSFRQAEEVVNYLWRENITKDKAVILVGNKADLARSRLIPTAEGKALAKSRDVKFIETSSGIQHNVDELLVGILKQIRLKETRDKKAAASTSKMRTSKTHMSLHLAKEILQKICLSDISKSKSCENLHVL